MDPGTSSTSNKMGEKPAFKIDNQAINNVFKFLRMHGTMITSELQRRISIENIRPLPIFLGITSNHCMSVDAFTSPLSSGRSSSNNNNTDNNNVAKSKAAMDLIKTRLSTNLSYYMSNYALIVMIVSFIIALLNPAMLLSLGVLWGLWTFHTFLLHNDLIIFGYNLASILTISQRHSILSALTFLVIVFRCMSFAKSVIAISSLIIFSHMLLRDSKHIEKNTSSTTGSGAIYEVPSGDDSEAEYNKETMPLNKDNDV